ncbi:MAG: glycosyltransferase family 1 protein [Caulobacterales bacterium]|nr:glycosyltransferase family 1 protein [Caulobacterales bacterium]
MTETPKSFLFALWEGGGTVAPALTAARKLVQRGHRVRALGDACNRAEAEAAGAEFLPWTRAPSRPDRTPATDPVRDWQYEGPAGLVQVITEVWTAPALAYARDVMAELRCEPADLVVTSGFLFGVAAGCEAAGQPFCILQPNINLFPTPGVPPMGLGLPPARTEAERAEHAAIGEQVTGLFDSGLPALNTARLALGLAPLAHLVDQTQAAAATLLATARAFDFTPAALPPGLHYIGPQLDEPAWAAAPFALPWEAEDERPLIVVGFSTTFQNHAAVLQRVLDAAAELPVRVLVTLGGSIPAGDLQPPANARLVESAPHDAVMGKAAVVVTHGGHGTVTRALVHRRPLLVIPHGRDQADNAVRVTERGAGLSLPPGATTEEIRKALKRLLREPGFRAAAVRLGEAVSYEARQSPVVEVLEGLASAQAQPALDAA